MINKDMKLIPKAQYGAQFIAQSDNTRVAKPIQKVIESNFIHLKNYQINMDYLQYKNKNK